MDARARERFYLQCVDSVRQLAGVADGPDVPCENGTPGCPGPDNPSGELPCPSCFLGGGRADV